MVSAPILAIFNRPPILQKDLISEHPESNIEPSLRGLSPFGAPVSALYVMSREMSETGVEDYVSSRVLRQVDAAAAMNVNVIYIEATLATVGERDVSFVGRPSGFQEL